MVQGKASPQFALEVLFLGPSDKELRNDLIKFPPLCPGPFQLCFWLTGTKAAGRGCTAGSLGSLVWLCSEAAAGSGVGRHYRGTSSPAHPPLPATTSLLPNGLWCLPPSSASARESSSPPLPGVDQSPPSWRASPNPVGSLFDLSFWAGSCLPGSFLVLPSPLHHGHQRAGCWALAHPAQDWVLWTAEFRISCRDACLIHVPFMKCLCLNVKE